MAYDEQLSDRIREIIGSEANLREQKMFGGLAFLVDDHMTVVVSGQGGLLVRLDPTTDDDMIAKGKAEPMVMRGRPMTGYLRVAADQYKTKRQLESWINRSVTFVRSLPPKKPKARTKATT